eukprot:1161244-Pelagomonas_calceolata.AAC.15
MEWKGKERYGKGSFTGETSRGIQVQGKGKKRKGSHSCTCLQGQLSQTLKKQAFELTWAFSFEREELRDFGFC